MSNKIIYQMPESVLDPSPEPMETTALPRPAISRFVWVLILTSLLAAMVVFAYQKYDNAVEIGFGIDLDEPAHYVSGLMIHDYLKSDLKLAPWRYATSYYEQLPKVAIGHWPPVFYFLEAGWISVFGDSRQAVLLMMVCLVGLTAAALVYLGWKDLGLAVIGVALIYGMAPANRDMHRYVMPDELMMAAICFAVLACSWCVQTEAWRPAIFFAVTAGLALMVKPASVCLVFVPLTAFLLTGRWKQLFTVRMIASALLVALITLPWYFAWRAETFAGHEEISFARNLQEVFTGLYRFLSFSVGWPLTIFAVFGLWVIFRDWREYMPRWAPVIGLIPGTLAILMVSRFTSYGHRYYITMLPAVFLLAGLGIVNLIPKRFPHREALAAFSLVLAGLLSWQSVSFRPPSGDRINEVSAYLRSTVSRSSRVLISSIDQGEGRMIATYAEGLQVRPNGWIMRATKLLAKSNWSSSDYRMMFTSSEDVSAFLSTQNFEYVVLHRWLARKPQPHHALLEKTVTTSPTWTPTRSFQSEAAIYTVFLNRNLRPDSPSPPPKQGRFVSGAH